MTQARQEQPAVTVTVVYFGKKVFQRRGFRILQSTTPTPYHDYPRRADRGSSYVQGTGIHALGEAISNCLERGADIEVNSGHGGVKRGRNVWFLQWSRINRALRTV